MAISSWKGDRQLRKLARNSLTLLKGNLAASVLTAVALALIARSLQPAEFGRFAVIIAYVFVVDSLTNFQSWQAIIRYGAERLSEADRDAFRALVKVGALLDLASAALGAALGMILAFALGELLKWSPADSLTAAVLSGTILTRATGTATGVLRLFDRFDVLSRQQFVVGVLRFSSVGLAYLNGSGLPVFVVAWGLSEIAGNLYVGREGWRILSVRGYARPFAVSAKEHMKQFAGLWQFLWTTNAHSSVKLAIRELDVLVLGAVSGQAAAGFYKLAKQAGAVAGKVVGPMYQAVYPELATSAAAGQRMQFSRMCIRPALVAVAIFGVLFGAFVAFGEALIAIVVGPEYAAAYLPAVVYLAGVYISVATFTLHPAALALGDARGSFRVLLASTLIYCAVFFLLVSRYAAMGAAISFVVFYVAWSAFMLILVRQRVQSRAWSG